MCPELRPSSSRLIRVQHVLPMSVEKPEVRSATEIESSEDPGKSISIDHDYCRKDVDDGTIGGHKTKDVFCQVDFRDLVTENQSTTNKTTQTKLTNIPALKGQIRKLQSKLRRMKQAEKRKRRWSDLALERLPVDLKDFIKNQINNFGRRPTGRRFTRTFYKNCFVIYHHSRQCYSALRGLLFMPSPRVLRRKLQTFFAKVRTLKLL